MDAATETATQILRATERAIARHGLQRVTLEDVAREAGVTRQTLYRYYGNRRQLIAAAMEREHKRFLRELQAVMAPCADLVLAAEAGFGFALKTLRGHAVFRRLLETEPGEILSYLAFDSAPVLASGRAVIEAMALSFQPGLDRKVLRRAADSAARLVQSHGISPFGEEAEVVARELAQLFCRGLGITVSQREETP
jgi:AcrR family transcriptional regulator